MAEKENKGPIIILYFVILVILIITGLVLPLIFRDPEFNDVRFCDLTGNTLDVADIELPVNEGLFICGFLDYSQNVEIDARLYENINEIRNFELQNVIISPGNFNFSLYPDFEWEPKLYYLKIFFGRQYVLATTELDFSK